MSHDDQSAENRHVIGNLEDLLAEHAPPQADMDVLARAIRSMSKGLLCWPCIQQARIQPGADAWEWQAITIVDGTALCGQHVIVKLRMERERGDG